jgi:large subunit ribosomal protein L17e
LPLAAAKARAKDLRVHFKNTYETATAIRGWNLKRAVRYLRDVLSHKRCIPLRRYRDHTGRTGQASQFGVTQGSKISQNFKES